MYIRANPSWDSETLPSREPLGSQGRNPRSARLRLQRRVNEGSGCGPPRRRRRRESIYDSNGNLKVDFTEENGKDASHGT